jgi:glycine reductase
LPTSQICTITSIAKAVGVFRIVPAVGIPHPLGDPTTTPAMEKILRRGLVERALRAVATKIETQTIFDI